MTPAERRLEVARVALHNAGKRLAAIAGAYRPDPQRRSEAAKQLEDAARAFVREEDQIRAQELRDSIAKEDVQS